MQLSSSNGTKKTIEDLSKAWSILQECYLRIQEINNGTYSPMCDPIQFDSNTCEELSNWVIKINNVTDNIDEIVHGLYDNF